MFNVPMSKEIIYNAAIIGAGRIGCGFDAPDSPHVLTHAHAITKNKRTTLAAIVDIDRVRGDKEAAKWDTRFFFDVDEMFGVVRPEIVIIATPDETHAHTLEYVVSKNPKLIILEKPVATSKEELQHLQGFNTEIPIIVNFRRRFDATVADVVQRLVHGEFGAVISASAIYDRGILHNASHILDLARMFFGEMISTSPRFSLDDFPGGAPSVSGTAVFERCSEFFLMHGDGRSYSFMEFDIIAHKKRIRFIDDGFTVEIQDIVPDPMFPGFQTLGKAESRKTHMADAMVELVAHAVRVIDGTEEPRSTLENAIKTQEACFAFAKDLE
jgi:predicted dehydrogenase